MPWRQGTGAGRGGTSRAQAPTATLARVVPLLLFSYIGVLSEILFKEMEELCWHNSWKTTRGGPLGSAVGLKTSQTVLLEAKSWGRQAFWGNLAFPRGSIGSSLLTETEWLLSPGPFASWAVLFFSFVVWGVLALQPCKGRIKLSLFLIQMDFVPGEALG